VRPPPELDRIALPQTEAALLAALMRLHSPTVRDLARAIGRSVGPTHKALRRLREQGWVAWDDGVAGSIHPTFMALWP
jgi:DNA-binding MarR family transcriptional regulator